MEYNKEDIKELLFEKLAGTISKEDDLVAEQAILLDTEVGEMWVDLNVKMAKPRTAAFLSELDADNSWAGVDSRIQDYRASRSRSTKWPYISAAAAILLAIPMIWFLMMKEPAKPQVNTAALKDVYLVPEQGDAVDLSYNRTVQIGGANVSATPKELAYTAGKNKGWATLHVPVTKDYKITLPDGTQVWMNSSTSLRFPYQFDQKTREVYLTGEAYFDVAKNKEQAFIVHTDYADIRVHGTSFNINAYDKENFSASLVEGSISAKSTMQWVRLAPGQEVRSVNKTLTVGNFDPQEVLSWRKGTYFFHNKPLSTISQVLSRWYDVGIAWKTPGIAEQNFTGEIDKSLPIEVVISNLQLSSGIKAELNNGVLTFR